MSRSLHLPARILKCIREAFSHMYHPEGLNILLSQGCVIGQLLAEGKQAEHTFQGQGRG